LGMMGELKDCDVHMKRGNGHVFSADRARKITAIDRMFPTASFGILVRGRSVLSAN
jgi:hypothetical protein